VAGALDSALSPGLALPVGSLVVHQLLQILGLVALRPARAILGLASAILLVLGISVVVLAALGPHHLLSAPKF
jgi:hypothetical protein